MARRTADEAENRRGLVLGLTLAELLLLLLFLFILALAWRVSIERKQSIELKTQLQTEVDRVHELTGKLQNEGALMRALEPLIAEMQRKGRLDEKQVKLLLDRATRVEALEREFGELKRSKSELMAEYMRLKSTVADSAKVASVDQALAAAQEINPNDPPAALIRAVEVLKKLGPNVRDQDIPDRSAMQTLAQAKDKLAAIEADRDKFRSQLNNIMKSGNGLTYPSCWRTPEDKTEYMFDIKIRDDGLVVADATQSRNDDPAWKMVQPFERGAVIGETIFDRATDKLFAWSVQEKCRFYVIIRDDTGPNSKQRYKQLRTLVEGHFYPLLLPATARSRGDKPTGVGGPFVPAPQPGFPAPIGSRR